MNIFFLTCILISRGGLEKIKDGKGGERQMKKIVVAGRNDSGKSTLLGEIYAGLKAKEYQPLVVASGVQDEKPLVQKGVDPIYLVTAAPEPGRDVAKDLERDIRVAIGKIEEKNNLIQHAKKALEELNKVRSVLELGQLTQPDIPPISKMPNVILAETVGVSDGYRGSDGKELADVLVAVVPAGIKTELLMENGNVLLDEADIIVVTKIDEIARNISNSNIKLLQRIYRDKPILPVVATQGVHTNLVVDEIIKKVKDPMNLFKDVIKTENKSPIKSLSNSVVKESNKSDSAKVESANKIV